MTRIIVFGEKINMIHDSSQLTIERFLKQKHLVQIKYFVLCGSFHLKQKTRSYPRIKIREELNNSLETFTSSKSRRIL